MKDRQCLFLVSFCLLSSLILFAHATSDSDPDYVYNCDALSPLWGCKPSQWPAGNRLKCSNTSRIMSWATEPSKSDCYRLLAGDEDVPAKEYTPDKYIFIHLRVMCFDMQYRGLMLYAVAEKDGVRVGNWNLPTDEPALFKLPWEEIADSPCAGTVMHAAGTIKPYHVAFYFKAPPEGTGKIVFRALIKRGDANTGDFFWPLEDLSLNEGKPKNGESVWVRSAAGESCTSACEAQTSVGCDESFFSSLDSPIAFQSNLAEDFPCKLPVLSGCGDQGASISEQGFCYFVDPSCPTQNRTGSSVNCDTQTPGSARFCPCADSGSSSNYKIPSLTLFLVPLFIFFSHNEKAGSLLAVLLLMGLLMSDGASAHNWVHSKSRSRTASTYPPCKAPLTDIPHTQVGPDQEFTIEWMTGHGFPTYFVVVHSKDSDKLALNTVKVLDDYLANAPAGSNTAQDPKWSKYHRKPTNNTNNDLTDSNTPNFFQRVVPTNDPYYIPRPLSSSTTTYYQLQYKPQDLVGDLRASYKNSNYPWIEAVAKFNIKTMAASRFDTARFVIPGFGGPGRYIVHYMWRGYRDCIDVDFKTETVAQPYGYLSSQSLWARIDHCLFEEVQGVYHTSEIVTDPTYCLDRCVTSSSCGGVNVVPIKAPPFAFQKFDLKSRTLFYPNIYGTDLYVPWNHTYFNTKPYLRDALLTNVTADKYMCYTVQPRTATDTKDEFTLATDPQDPLFYSTCFFRLTVNMFDDYAAGYQASRVDVPWRFQDQCIECHQRALNAYPKTTPKWDMAHVCVNCDEEPVNVPAPSFPLPLLVENSVRCDGADNTTFSRAVHHTCPGNGTDCHKSLIPAGRDRANPVSLEECRALVERDPVCSEFFTYANRTTSPKCQCYVKKSCCNVCSRVPATNYHVYQTRTVADPTCSRGVLSADGKSCCSGQCGAGNCINTTSAVNPIGFCCASCIPATRPCSQFGPPCKLP